MLTLENTDVNFHRLLKRQIRKSLPDELATHPLMQEFLTSVNQAYLEFQDDLVRVETILEQSSNELFKTNKELSRIAEEKTEEAASTSKRLEDVVSSISEVLVQLDKNGNFVYLNNAWEAVSSHSVADSMGKSLLTFVPQDFEERFQAWFTSDEENIEDTVQISTADGTEKWLRISLRHHRSADYDFGCIGTFVDITQRVEAERKLKSYMRDLEKINAELDQFAYVVSHDLKAPLRAINNLSEWIEEDISHLLGGDTKDQFRLLRGRVHRMESLINGILSYSRAGRIKTTKERFLIKTIVEELCDTLKTLNHSTRFVFEGDASIELVSEKIALGQILQNLISNGIKYNDKKEIRITIGWTDHETAVDFFVTDNGPGISPEFHDKIFVIFQTLQARDEVESTGVGLAIVKKILDEKGGYVVVESALGEGSTFRFSWPKTENKQGENQA